MKLLILALLMMCIGISLSFISLLMTVWDISTNLILLRYGLSSLVFSILLIMCALLYDFISDYVEEKHEKVKKK